MHQLGKAALVIGVVSVVVAIVSRLTYTPVLGVKASGIIEFAKVCFVLSIAASLGSCKK